MSAVNNKHLKDPEQRNGLVKALYELYAKKLLAYTSKNYSINEDDAWTIVYKTIYKMADVNDQYTFENEYKRSGFIFKTHINFLRNHFRDVKTFESKNLEVELKDDQASKTEEESKRENPAMLVLQKELDKLEEWERILLLMRGQDMPYSTIVPFVNKHEDQLKVYYGRLKKKLLENVNIELLKLNTVRDEK